MATQDFFEHVEPGVFAALRAVAAVHHGWHPRLGEQAPCRVQQRVTRVEGPDLDVRLDAPRPGVERFGQVARDRRLGEDRRRGHRVGRAGREVQRPVGQPGRHVRLVRVNKRGEGRHPEVAEHLQPGLLGVPVVDRPLSAVVRGRLVEERPDLVHDPLGQEVRVDVDQPGQPEFGHPGRDVRVAARNH